MKKVTKSKRLSEIDYNVILWGDSSVAGRGERNLREIIVRTLAALPEEVYENLIGERSVMFFGCGSEQLGEAFRLFPCSRGSRESPSGHR